MQLIMIRSGTMTELKNMTELIQIDCSTEKLQRTIFLKVIPEQIRRNVKLPP